MTSRRSSHYPTAGLLDDLRLVTLATYRRSLRGEITYLYFMKSDVIQTYTYKHSETIGIEAKTSDFLWGKQEMSSMMHRVSFYHLIWIEEGELLLTLDFQTYCLTAHQALLIAVGQVCRFHTEHTPPKAYSVLFRAEVLGAHHTDQSLLHPLLYRPLTLSPIITLHPEIVRPHFSLLTQELQKDHDTLTNIIVHNHLRILLAQVMRHIHPSIGRASDQTLQRFIEVVEANYHKTHHVSHYLQILSIPERKLTDCVLSLTGLRPKAYIDQRIMLEAKRLLIHSTLSIKEVAFSLGFDEPTNFNKFFRKHSSTTPQSFRLDNRID